MAAVGSRKMSRCMWGQPTSAVQPRSGEGMQGVGLVPKAGEPRKGVRNYRDPHATASPPLPHPHIESDVR